MRKGWTESIGSKEVNTTQRERESETTVYDTRERHRWPTVQGTEGSIHQDTRYGTEVVFDNM